MRAGIHLRDSIIFNLASIGVSTSAIQWNLSYVNTIGTKTFVLISEVSLFQGDKNMYLYKAGTRSSVLFNQVSLFQVSSV